MYLIILHLYNYAQENPVVEQQIENITEVNESETEDDSYVQLLQHFIRHKVNLNTATESDLKEFPFLTALQISNFISYRKLFGLLVNLYELQAVPSWNIETIQKLVPYIFIGPALTLKQDLLARLRNGEHSVLSRIVFVPEKSQGFVRRNDTSASSYYPGSRLRLLIRYKYSFGNKLQYGFTAENDPGEQFFKGAQKYGFDFYSAHLFVRNAGIIKHLAIGDFTVNIGQGLMQWQSLAFKKSADVLNVKRQAAILRPYNSTGEYFFNRGAGITLEKKKLQLTAYASLRKVSGNIVADTLQAEDYFSSLLTSGLHRTQNETADRNRVQINSFGGNISYNHNNLHVGLNAVHFRFNRPLVKDPQPYNNFAFNGKQLTNYSFDWSYTFKNIHWFGEAASHNLEYYGLLSGLLMSVDPKVDFSFVYRNIQAGYQSIFGNAFTEGTYPVNEKGLFAGISIRPSSKWKFDGYADLYRFPYLRYRVDAPSNGKDFLLQITYRPNKQIEIYSRFRTESKALNFSNEGALQTAEVNPVKRLNWRTQAQFKVSQAVTLRQRMDAMWYDLDGKVPSQGFLAFFDVFYKPLMKPFSANLRLQYFETEDYNSRIYAFENDILFSYSIPAFYDKGTRYYLNLNYDISKKISLWLRWSQTIFRNRGSVGSGLDEITGNKRSEAKCQLLVRL
ncbi:MAG: helix-hairpin-helix domain-containing protein [Lacibacter sp.]